MQIGKYEIVTVEFFLFGYTVRITQKYITEYDFGHYSYVVYSNANPHAIIEVGETNGAAPDGKVGQDTAKEIVNRAIRNWDEFVQFATGPITEKAPF